ncbi:MAG: hypothetical protein JNN15_19070 [Blastocatellia bacterium]|nr:hypothetical protein [Blastocatellia bacterium]
MSDTTESEHHLDMFGSSQITLEQIKEKLGDTLEERLRKRDFKGIEEAIKQIGKFAYVSVSEIAYIENDVTSSYTTINLVDEKDRASRMLFFDPPTKEFPDPNGLIATWREYTRVNKQW